MAKRWQAWGLLMDNCGDPDLVEFYDDRRPVSHRRLGDRPKLVTLDDLGRAGK